MNLIQSRFTLECRRLEINQLRKAKAMYVSRKRPSSRYSKLPICRNQIIGKSEFESAFLVLHRNTVHLFLGRLSCRFVPAWR